MRATLILAYSSSIKRGTSIGQGLWRLDIRIPSNSSYLGQRILSFSLSLAYTYLYTAPSTRTMRILNDKHRWHGSTCRLFVTVHSFLIMCWARATCVNASTARFEGVVKCGDMRWRLSLFFFSFFIFRFVRQFRRNRGLIAAEVAKYDNFGFEYNSKVFQSCWIIRRENYIIEWFAFRLLDLLKREVAANL